MNNYILFILVVLFAIVFYLRSKTRKHHWNIWLASRRIKRLNRIKEPWDKFRYLRKTNPYVFEEMVLTGLKRKGYRIKRSKSYSGDGGVDGKAVINGRNYLIQSKRYSNHIKPKHVKEFSWLCKSQNKHGLFVHTGRTGSQSKNMIRYGYIQFISGRRLLELLN